MSESLFTPIHQDDNELEHYGVKGMKWGVRKKRDDKTYNQATLDFSKSAGVFKRGEARLRPLEEKVAANSKKRLKGEAKKQAKRDGKELLRVDKEETAKYYEAAKQDRKNNRAKLKQIYKENGGDKRTVGKRVTESIIGTGILTGYNEARMYGARISAFIAGPMAGVAYREARLLAEPMNKKYR